MKLFGAKIGKEVFISTGVFVDYLFPELITIGDGSIIGKDVNLLTHEFTINTAQFGKINIGKKVTIGAKSIVRCGITIKDNSIIAMDSLVNNDVKENQVVGGIPIRYIKKIKK